MSGEVLPLVDRDGKAIVSPVTDPAYDMDVLLEKVGPGRFQLGMLALFGWANASDAVELLAISFVIASRADCDLWLTESRKGYITASVFVGMMIGGWSWGVAADRSGRKRALILALVFNAVFGILSAFSANFGEFLATRLISGLGVGGSIPILFSYFCEFLPPSNRGFYLSLVAAFWMVGTVLAAGLAWLIISPKECVREASDYPLDEYCEIEEARNCGHMWFFGDVATWRVFVGVCAMPAALTAVAMILFAPESPKWLISKKRYDEADATLRRLAVTNRYTTWEGSRAISIRPADVPGDTVTVNLPPSRQGTKMQSMVWNLQSRIEFFRSNTARVFHGSNKRSMLLLAAIWFLLSFGFYGLTLWLPSYFKNGGLEDGADIYETSFYVALANIPGNIFAATMMDRIGRRGVLSASLVVSGVSVFFIFVVKNNAGTTAFSCVFSGISVAAWNALDILSAELFTTEVRSTAFGMLASIGRVGAILGNVLFGELSSGSAALPLILTGTALVSSVTFCFLLPRQQGSYSLH